MKFPYWPAVLLSAETGDPVFILRPEITIRAIGPVRSEQYRALVDTGADTSVFPKSVADDLGVTLIHGAGPEVETFDGKRLPTLFGDLTLELTDGDVIWRWPVRMQFFDFGIKDRESLVLGHSRFLDFFTAAFDSMNAELTLEQNSDFPSV
jgi:hypothetical protein